jgi:hypothetical protein
MNAHGSSEPPAALYAGWLEDPLGLTFSKTAAGVASGDIGNRRAGHGFASTCAAALAIHSGGRPFIAY